MKPNRLNQLLEFEKDTPNDPFILYALAMEYAKLGNNESALSYYKNLLENHTDYLATYYHLGQLYEKVDEEAQALEVYKQGMQVATKQGDTHTYNELRSVKEELEF